MGTLEWPLAGLFVAVLLVATLGFSRLRLLSLHVGSIETRMRNRSDRPHGQSWSSGFGVYHADRFDWWRSRSLWLAPKYSWHRDHFAVLGHDLLDAADSPVLLLVHCQYRDHYFDLVMTVEAYSGLASWTEAAPPSVRRQVF